MTSSIQSQANSISTPPLMGNTCAAMWILDSRATDHIGCSLLFYTSHKRIKLVLVYLPNGNTLTCSHFGIVCLSNSLVVHNVLFSPNFSFNLISITKLTSHQYCQLIFSPNLCVIQDISTLKRIGTTRVEGGLYILKDSGCTCNSPTLPSFIRNTIADKTFDLWHFRLGHTPLDRINVIHNKFPIVLCTNKDLICDICHFAKQKTI